MKKNEVHIVLTEDDDADYEFFQQALAESRQSHVLTRLTNGEKLIEFLHETKRQPDVIFLDLNMPVKCGKETLIEIKNHEIFRKIPVIIFSTSRQQEEINYCYQAGANWYIAKPFEFEGWVNIITHICEQLKHLILLPRI